jgi:CHAD domain-containing protein
MRKIKWDKALSAEENARQRLPEMAAAYFAEGRALTAGEPPAAELHPFRLATKRVRYTLEMFGPVYGAGLDKYLAELRQVQTLLGAINDCAAARERLDGLLPPGSAERARMANFLDGREASLTADFLKFWRTEFDAQGSEARWREYLGAPEATPPRKRPAKKATAPRRAPARPSSGRR